MAARKDRETSIPRLVQILADSVAAQNEAIMAGDARTGNKHAKRYIGAWRRLRSYGNEGLEALSELLDHSRPDVRATAAAFLLRYKTEEALATLREIAKGRGLAAFEASKAIKRWDEGEWHLDE